MKAEATASGAERGRAKRPWPARLGEAASIYLPLVLMALLALLTWWLVKNNPVLEPVGPAAPPRHEPDYTMRDFTVQRFGPDGVMQTEIEGDVALHFPDTDTLEIENPRIRSIDPNGRVTRASAARALANGDGSEVQLMVGAHVVREATSNEETIDFRSDFLHVFRNSEQVRTHLPVTVTQGANQVHAQGMVYDNLARVVDLTGRMSGVFTPPPRSGGPG